MALDSARIVCAVLRRFHVHGSQTMRAIGLKMTSAFPLALSGILVAGVHSLLMSSIRKLVGMRWDESKEAYDLHVHITPGVVVVSLAGHSPKERKDPSSRVGRPL